jgi:hypothetical protein
VADPAGIPKVTEVDPICNSTSASEKHTQLEHDEEHLHTVMQVMHVGKIKYLRWGEHGGLKSHTINTATPRGATVPVLSAKTIVTVPKHKKFHLLPSSRVCLLHTLVCVCVHSKAKLAAHVSLRLARNASPCSGEALTTPACHACGHTGFLRTLLVHAIRKNIPY